jgi:hypothetical protein
MRPPGQEDPVPIETDRPFREWPLEQLAEQALLHAADRVVLAGLGQEAGRRPGARAKALQARIERMRQAAEAAPRGAGSVELREMLAAAAQEIGLLRARLAAREAAMACPGPEASAPGPHRRVYLTPDAPAWLVADVRRAFRRRYHPDAHDDPGRRRRAEEVFKRAEAVFAEIERMR